MFASTVATVRIRRSQGQIGIVHIEVQRSYCRHDIGQRIRSCCDCSQIGHQHSQVRIDIVDIASDQIKISKHFIQLLFYNFRIHPDILTDKDCEIVYELVYSSHRGVAQAAAEFLNVRLFHLDEDSIDVVKTKRGKKRLPNTPLIRDLVQFFIESELHEHGAYLVDSFIDNNPMVKDWECMTDLLIEEPGPNEEQLDNKQESTLIEIMVSAVRQCSTGEPPVGRGTSRKMVCIYRFKLLSDIIEFLCFCCCTDSDIQRSEASPRGQAKDDGAFHSNVAEIVGTIWCRCRKIGQSHGNSAVFRFGCVHQFTTRGRKYMKMDCRKSLLHGSQLIGMCVCYRICNRFWIK